MNSVKFLLYCVFVIGLVKTSICSGRILGGISFECKLYPINPSDDIIYDINYEGVLNTACVTSHLSSIHPTSFIHSATFYNYDDQDIDLDEVGVLRIENSANVKFVPARINKMLPKVKKIFIVNCGLIHIEKNDMKQFGNDLILADMSKNHLRALQSNLFGHNTQLTEVNFYGNPLKFVDLAILNKINFVMDKKFRVAAFDGCVSYKFDYRGSSNYDNEKCNDAGEKQQNLQLVQRRAEFFMREFNSTNTEMEDIKITNITLNTRIEKDEKSVQMKLTREACKNF